MTWYGKSDRAILREVGTRVRRRRLDRNISQQHLAEIAGLNRTTVSEFERGSPASLLTFVQILRALDALDELDSFLAEPLPSPLQLARLKGKQRRRASRHTATGDDVHVDKEPGSDPDTASDAARDSDAEGEPEW